MDPSYSGHVGPQNREHVGAAGPSRVSIRSIRRVVERMEAAPKVDGSYGGGDYGGWAVEELVAAAEELLLSMVPAGGVVRQGNGGGETAGQEGNEGLGDGVYRTGDAEVCLGHVEKV